MISIVDDDRSVREAVRSLVRSLGHEAETFSSAEEFLGSERVDDSECVITDLQMTGMTGTDLQRHLIDFGYCKRIILMSARSTEEIGVAAKDSASCRFLRKPFSDDRLLECLDWALKGGFVKSPPTQPTNESCHANRFQPAWGRRLGPKRLLKLSDKRPAVGLSATMA
jgi:FixJ family two-component response regulator